MNQIRVFDNGNDERFVEIDGKKLDCVRSATINIDPAGARVSLDLVSCALDITCAIDDMTTELFGKRYKLAEVVKESPADAKNEYKQKYPSDDSIRSITPPEPGEGTP